MMFVQYSRKEVEYCDVDGSESRGGRRDLSRLRKNSALQEFLHKMEV
jgi:hypothetical protein